MTQVLPEVRIPDIDPGWQRVLVDAFSAESMARLKAFLLEEIRQHTVYPPAGDVFNAFVHTPFADTKVVILGQDPYHGPGQAHGLSFSVPQGIDKPPSLENIFKELHHDLKIPLPSHGDLTPWARQGVLLLNTCLTVRHKSPQSHSGQGWETFTDQVIDVLNEQREGLVFLFWGTPARRKASLIDRNRHFILEAPHPSPLSAYRGFFGCGHFSTCNEILCAQGKAPIDWNL